MMELFAFAALGVAALVVLGVLMMIGAVLKLAFKIAFLPLAIIGGILGLIALAVMIPVGLVVLPLALVAVVVACCLAIVATICWVGFSALAACFMADNLGLEFL